VFVEKKIELWAFCFFVFNGFVNLTSPLNIKIFLFFAIIHCNNINIRKQARHMSIPLLMKIARMPFAFFFATDLNIICVSKLRAAGHCAPQYL